MTYEGLIVVDKSGYYLADVDGTVLRHCTLWTPVRIVVQLAEEYFSDADELVIAGRGWPKQILLCDEEFNQSVLNDKDTLFIELGKRGLDGVQEAVDLLVDA